MASSVWHGDRSVAFIVSEENPSLLSMQQCEQGPVPEVLSQIIELSNTAA